MYDSIPTDPEHIELDTLPELKADGKYTIGCAMTNVSTGWFKGLYDNLKILLDEAGINVLLVECNDDANEQVNQVENFIAQKVDAIIINPANPQETVTSVLEDTCEAGIPVVAVDVPPEEGAAYLTACVTDAYQLGYMVGEELAARLLEMYPEGEIEYGLIGGTDGNSIAALRNQGARDAIAAVDTEGRIVEAVFLYAGAYSEESGLETAQNMLSANQNLKCIIGTCDAHIVGATSAAEQLDLADNLIMGAVDGSKGALEIMKDGGPIVALGLNSPYQVGEAAARTILGYLNDGTLPPTKTLQMEPTLVTPDIVDDYYDPEAAW
ncbi:sugar ABC transporter substrate-binding protein [Candidatus Merdisoma sp. JLR.KK006]|uniref:sugar ABC transporter substrate-binding protein n=1 Tax=Candidatus Merdisoma sp. JLR.KK006 TaxID=3112626 RepID=UPI002FEFD4DE